MKIILIGFMGAGKTTVAGELAKRLGLEKAETDEMAVKLSGENSVAGIFLKYGEIRFRELELEVSRSLINSDGVVISTGGGMVMNKLNLDYLRCGGTVIYLKTGFPAIVKRLAGDDSRPLFKDKDKAKELYEFRTPLYQRYAEMTVSTDGKTVAGIINEIINNLK